jgi:hypothetical protein
VRCCKVNTRLLLVRAEGEIACRVEDLLVVAQRTNGRVDETDRGVWRRRVETHKASCLAQCHPVLHQARPSLVSHSVCNLQSALRHHHSISIQCIPFTPPNKFNSKHFEHQEESPTQNRTLATKCQNIHKNQTSMPN